jgi:aerobic-type carbon monoxide dehydrogenase small subunit (CoxS/CutS family)
MARCELPHGGDRRIACAGALRGDILGLMANAERPPARLLSLTVNGQRHALAVQPHHTLLEVLRYQLDLVGSKQGCDKGDCGACTVQVDGQPRLSCITLALQAEGREVTTVEGLGLQHGGCHPLQDAFDRWDAAQCGFCTPGILMSAEALIRRVRRPVTDSEVREALAGNLCRCTGYTKIIDAVVDASRVISRDGAGDATAQDDAASAAQ